MSNPIEFPAIFNLSKLSEVSGIQYDRLVNVLKGKRDTGFTAEERVVLKKAINNEMKKAIAFLGTPAEVA